jgi:hypothetical protein
MESSSCYDLNEKIYLNKKVEKNLPNALYIHLSFYRLN